MRLVVGCGCGMLLVSLAALRAQCRSAEHPTVSAFRAGTIPEVVTLRGKCSLRVDDPVCPMLVPSLRWARLLPCAAVVLY